MISRDAVEKGAPGELPTTALPFALGLGVLMAVDTRFSPSTP